MARHWPITAEQVKQRREETGRGMMQVKRDMQIEILNTEIGVFAHSNPELADILGGMMELIGPS